jgi:hypothetical protein
MVRLPASACAGPQPTETPHVGSQPGFTLYRGETLYTLGAAHAYEGFWFVVATPPPDVDVLARFEEFSSAIFTEPEGTYGVSRADLMGTGAELHRVRVLEFALEFLEIESELVSAVIGLPATSDSACLPASVSKLLLLKPGRGGRGNYSRMYTSFHPAFAVDPDDCRRATDDYLAQLFSWYDFMFSAFRVFPIWRKPFGHLLIPQTPTVGVLHWLNRPARPATYTFAELASINIPNRVWGTMRTRGPGEIRTGGRDSRRWTPPGN